jgi:hypothetical protein
MRLTSGGRLRVLALLCAALAAACTTTVDGRGTLAADGSVPPGSGGAPSGSTTPSDTGSSSPSGQPGRDSLSCGGGTVIQPRGAPYCFTVPDGFADVSKSVTVDASIGDERFRSAVAVRERDRDLIIVTTYELRVDADPIGDDVLERELTGVLGQLTRQGFTFDSTDAKRISVDGARAFGYHAREPRDRLQADVYFVFRGRNELEINCQWRDAPADVQRGCTSVLSGMRFKTVS